MSNELRTLLELTLDQHRTKRLADLARARVDELARTTLETTGAAPSWKIPGLGQIRLDGAAADETPTAYIADETALASYVAERWPTEAIATITVRADQLEAALESLRFAEVDVDGSSVMARSHQAAKVLAAVTLVEEQTADVELGEGEEPAPPSWVAVDVDGQIVPGVAGRITPAAPRLVVAADKSAKDAVSAEADAQYAKVLAELDETPVVDEDAEVESPEAAGAA
jgi:hypothetical protein